MSAHALNHQYRNWLIKAPPELVLTGFGASLISDAAVYRQSGASTLRWVGYGTLALTVFNSGPSILSDAAKPRARYERLKETPPQSPDPGNRS